MPPKGKVANTKQKGNLHGTHCGSNIQTTWKSKDPSQANKMNVEKESEEQATLKKN